MALVEASDGEYFSQSEAESVPSALGSVTTGVRQDLRHVRNNDIEKISRLLKQRCTCSEGSCFTQLRGMEAQVADLRQGFREMQPNKKET